MIKTENDIYYMTAGETCYIIKQTDGKLSRLFFGKRVEAEDDLSALGMEKTAMAEAPMITATVNGAPRIAALKVIGSEILAEKPTDGAVPIGGKTLRIHMSDTKMKLNATATYTPYSRGGVLRSFVIENLGKEQITLDWSLVLREYSADCAIVTTEGEASTLQKPRSFAAVVRDCTETHGEACAFLNVYGGDDICLNKTENGTALCCAERGIVLNKGESYRSPDLLCVYSDGGLGKMSRIFHDILRDNRVLGMRAERAPVVLFAPVVAENMAESVREASELGCDVYAVDGGDVTQEQLQVLSEACKSVGIKLGLKITRTAKKKSDILLCKLFELVQTFDIEYIILDGALGGARDMFGALSEKFPELFIELDSYGQEVGDETLYAPPGAMRKVVEMTGVGSLKSRFDRATFGRLGYAFDPLKAESDIKRAVRAQILSYQDDAALILGGDLYRVRSSNGDKCLIAVSKDKSGAYAVCEIKGERATSVRLGGLDEHNIYHVRELGKSFSGAALCACGVPLPPSNEQAAVTLHIRQVADYE